MLSSRTAHNCSVNDWNYQLHVFIKKELESRRRDWNRTSIIVPESYKVPGTSPYHSRTLLFDYIIWQTLNKVSVCCFRTFIDLLRCAVLRNSIAQPTAFPFALPVPAIQSPAWFILSAFTAFATSGDALAGLSLLSILGRRSWIVSLAPSYMPFFCVSIFQRTSFCGRKRCDPQELSEARA